MHIAASVSSRASSCSRRASPMWLSCPFTRRQRAKRRTEERRLVVTEEDWAGIAGELGALQEDELRCMTRRSTPWLPRTVRGDQGHELQILDLAGSDEFGCDD